MCTWKTQNVIAANIYVLTLCKIMPVVVGVDGPKLLMKPFKFILNNSYREMFLQRFYGCNTLQMKCIHVGPRYDLDTLKQMEIWFKTLEVTPHQQLNWIEYLGDRITVVFLIFLNKFPSISKTFFFRYSYHPQSITIWKVIKVVCSLQLPRHWEKC